MELQANNLRIGNLVYDTFNKIDEHQFKITFLEVDDFVCMQNFINSNHPIPYKPIQLTEEWLLGFGFTAESNYDNFKLNGFEISSTVRVISTNERQCFYLCLTEDSIFNRKIDYVHELQNIYLDFKDEELIFNK